MKIFVYLITIILISFVSFNIQAYTPFYVNSSGEPIVWDGELTLNPETGGCQTLTNEEMIANITNTITGVEQWANTDIDGGGQVDVNLTINVVEGPDAQDNNGEFVMNDNIDVNNYDSVYASTGNDADIDDDINPIIFDNDGSIVEDIFGQCNQFVVLGFAGPDNFDGTTIANSSTIIAGTGVFNCRCLNADNCNFDEMSNPDLDTDNTADCASAFGVDSGEGIEFKEDDIKATIVHEIGHMLGLDHSQANASVIGSGGCDTESDGDCDDLPTLYPIIEDGADQKTLSRDDQAGIIALYGNNRSDDNTCIISGSLVDKNGDPLRCAAIDAESLNGDESNTVEVVSGGFALASDTNGDGYTDSDGECTSNCGDFALYGLKPNTNYSLTVRPIDPTFINASGIPPCATGQLTGIKTEVLKSSVSCTAGTNKNLGELTADKSSGGISDDDDEDSESSSAACSLNRSAQKQFSRLPLFLFTNLLIILFIRLRKNII